MTATEQHEETIACEGCEAVVPESEIESSLDGVWLCKACMGEWKREMAACDHAWQRSIEHFDFSRACMKCGSVEELTAEEFAAVPEEAP